MGGGGGGGGETGTQTKKMNFHLIFAFFRFHITKRHLEW